MNITTTIQRRMHAKANRAIALPERQEMEAAAAAVGLDVLRLEGDYAAGGYDPVHSPFMIWTFERRGDSGIRGRRGA